MAPEECDCTDVCGWTMPHTVPEGKTHCSNCGTSSLGGEEFMEKLHGGSNDRASG
jgi:hypothetical protein